MIDTVYAFAAKEIKASKKKEIGTLYCLPETKISKNIVCPNIMRGHWDRTDGIMSEVLEEKMGVKKVRILDSKDKDAIAYIVTDGEFSAHGSTIEEAKKDLIFKKSKVDLTEYKDWKLSDVKTLEELICAYRSITGACSKGTQAFCDREERPKKMTVAKAIEITKGEYNWEKFSNFEWKKDTKKETKKDTKKEINTKEANTKKETKKEKKETKKETKEETKEDTGTSK